MISDFAKSRFENKNQPLVARLVFLTTKQQASEEATSAFEKKEYKTNKIIKNDYSEDIQKHLDTLSTDDTHLKDKLPSKWFQVDTVPGEKSEGEVQARVDKMYGEIFSDTGPLKEQLEAYKKKYGTDEQGRPVTVETMVFGSSAADDIKEKNPNKNADELKELEGAEKSIRLKAVRDRLENLSKTREKQKEKLTFGNTMKKLGEGVSNITESFQENLSGGKYLEAGIQAVGIFLLLHSAFKLLKKKPDDENFIEYLGKNLLKAAVGIGILMPDATRGKYDLLNLTKLTSTADKMTDRGGLSELMKGLDWRTRTEAETLNALVSVDIGDIHSEYEKARAEGRSEIDPKKLLGKNAPKKSILNGKELFNIVEKVLERYGAKYFELVMNRPPDPNNPQEIQDGITLLVRYHKKTDNQSKSFASVVAREEAGFEDWKNSARVEGKIPILAGIAGNIGLSILHPTKITENLDKAFYGWLNLFEINHEWFDAKIKGPIKNKIIETYNDNKPQAEAFIKDIVGFVKSGWGDLVDDPEKFITDVGTQGVDVTMDIAGATLKGIYKIGAGMTRVTLNVGGKIYENVEAHVNTPGSPGNILIFAPWIPYSYDSEKNEWKRASLADASKKTKEITIGGVSYVYSSSAEKIDDVAKWLSVYLEKGLPEQWEKSIKPMLKKAGIQIVGGYELFAGFTKAVISENIIPASKATGKSIAEFFSDDDNLIRSFYKAAKEAGAEGIEKFTSGAMSLTEFLSTYAKETKEKEQNIKDFEEIIKDPTKEKRYFDQNGTLQNLEPKIRAWLFSHLGWWNLDMSASTAKFDTSNKFIEYDEITLKSIGPLGSLPFTGNKKCKLRVNFSPDGNLGSKTRFELTPEDIQTLNLGPDDLSKYESAREAVEDAQEIKERKEKLADAQKILDSDSDGKFELLGKEFQQSNDAEIIDPNFNWLDKDNFYKYTHTDAQGNIFEISIPIPSGKAFYLQVPGVNQSKSLSLKQLKENLIGAIEQKNSELEAAREEALVLQKRIEARANRVLLTRKKMGDDGEGNFEIKKAVFKKIDANGGIKNWLNDDEYFTYKYTNQNSENFFIKIPVSPAKPIIFEAPGNQPMHSFSTSEVKKAIKEKLTGEKKNETEEQLQNLSIENLGVVKQGASGRIVLTGAKLNTSWLRGEGVKLEEITFKQNEVIINFSEKNNKYIQINDDLTYRIGREVTPGNYTVELAFEMNDVKKTVPFEITVQAK